MIETTPKPAQAYQLLPALDNDQRQSLRQSIETNGILQPIEVDEDGRILDGHHRAAIAAELGIACPSRTIDNLDEAGKRRYALTVNLMRRQLGKDTRAELIAQLRSEGMSLRAISAETGIPKSEVGRSVQQLSQLGQLDQPERVKSLDGKERPASQPRPAPAVATPTVESPAPSASDQEDPVFEESDPPWETDLTEDDSAPDLGGSNPAMPWPVAEDTPPRPVDESAHAARVSNDIRRLITLAQTFGSDELRKQAIRLYADRLGNAPMPPSGVVSAQELRRAAEAISALAKDWNKK